MGLDTLKPPVYFVCGTPRDRYGFEDITLDGQQFPNRWLASYLDNIPTEKLPKRGDATHFFYRDEIEGWAIYAEYRSIHPSDTEYNRGAFIAVGCWSNVALTPDQAMEALFRIETVHLDLEEKRDPDANSFYPEFQLREYTAPNSGRMLDSNDVERICLADLFCQAAVGRGTYSEDFGRLLLTSNEIEQGSLADLCIHQPRTSNVSEGHGVPNSGSWQILLHKLIRDADRKAPQTRQLLRELLKIEERRAKIFQSLRRVEKAAPRRLLPNKMVNDGTEWHFTTRDIISFTLGTAITIVVALAAFFIARFLGM